MKYNFMKIYWKLSIRYTNILLVVMFFCGACNYKAPDGTVEFSPSVIHILAQRDSVYKKTIYVKNNSLKNIFIRDISTSCGCTVAHLKDSIVNSKDSVPINVEYSAKQNDTGNFVRFVSIRTNGNPPIKTIELKVKIKE